MKARSVLCHRLLTIALLAVASGAALALALPPSARAQPEPTMVITPPSGPCDATVEVRGTAFEAGSDIPLDLGGPHSGVSMGRLAVATAGPDGEFTVEVSFGSLGCEAAARDTEADDPGERKELVVFAGYDPAREFITTRAPYHYTTTTPSLACVLPPGGHGSGALPSGRPFAGLAAIVGVASAGVALFALSYWTTRRQRRRVR